MKTYREITKADLLLADLKQHARMNAMRWNPEKAAIILQKRKINNVTDFADSYGHKNPIRAFLDEYLNEICAA